jgi:quercetin dioxygenase-like cupin family protein
MATLIKKSLNHSEDTQTHEKRRVDTVVLNGMKIQRITAEPGWKWSKHMKPVVGGDSCQVDHFVYVISGKLRTRMNDGNEEELGPGEAGVIPSGHDGWNAGDDPAVWLELPNEK